MKQQPKLVLTFYTSAGAMELERLCKAAGVPGRLAPVPRSITSDCGIGWTMPLADKPKLLAALNHRIGTEQIRAEVLRALRRDGVPE